MLWTQFYLAFSHFVIHTLAALVLFAVFWLYFDAWLVKKKAILVPKLLGLALLAISYLIEGTVLDISTTTSTLFGATFGAGFVVLTRITAYVALILGLYTEPIQKRPHRRVSSAAAILIPGIGLPIIDAAPLLFPVMAGIVTLLYWRTATVGLENHLRTVAASFALITLSHLIGLAKLFRTTTNPSLFKVVAPFASLWVLERLVLLAGVILLGRWVWGYLIKRFQSQLFMILMTGTLSAFLVTTIIFTSVILRYIQDAALESMATNVKVLELALASKQETALSDAQSLSADTGLGEYVLAKNREELSNLAQDLLLAKNQSSLVFTDMHGQVLARGEDQDRIGMALSSDPLVASALAGTTEAAVVKNEGAFAPEMAVAAAAPIIQDGQTVGAVRISTALDNAFVDGVKSATGLEAALYGDNILAATTLGSSSKVGRVIGVAIDDTEITSTVLEAGQAYQGLVELLSVPYAASFLPLTDVDSQPIGMLFVGQPQYRLLDAAAESIELTFLVAAGLMLAAIVPSYYIARYLEYQIQ